MKYLRRELAHHEGPYFACGIPVEKRQIYLLAFLGEIARIFDNGGADTDTFVIPEDILNNFESLTAFIGAHLNVEAFVVSGAAQEHIEVSTSSDTADNIGAPTTPGDVDKAEDTENKFEVSVTASVNTKTYLVSPVRSPSVRRCKVCIDLGSRSIRHTYQCPRFPPAPLRPQLIVETANIILVHQTIDRNS